MVEFLSKCSNCDNKIHCLIDAYVCTNAYGGKHHDTPFVCAYCAEESIKTKGEPICLICGEKLKKMIEKQK